MPLENKLKCKRGCEDSLVEKIEEHDILNYLCGAGIGVSISVVALDAFYPTSLIFSPVPGFIFYFADIPFGAKKYYKCKECGYKWKIE